MTKGQNNSLYVGVLAAMFGLLVLILLSISATEKVEWKDMALEPKKDSSIEDYKLGLVQEVSCEGVNFSACMVQANYTCGGEGTWVPVAYPGDQFAMGHWIHDGDCYTGQSMLIQCKR